MDYKIALVGNPNVGKTSLFNRITHSAEHVGNWHGVTVKEASKTVLYNHKRLQITDLPGLYSLTVYSPEEGVTRDGVLSGAHDAVVCVCEVNNLSRNLYLALQLLELDVPLVVVINMMDELKKQGRSLNYRKIEQALKVPVVPMSARYHSDVHLLMDVACDFIEEHRNNKVNLTYLEKLPIADIVTIIGKNAEEAGLNPKWAAIKLLEHDALVTEKLNLSDVQKAAVAAFGDLQAEVAAARYDFIDEITAGAISRPVSVEHSEMHEHDAHDVPIEGREKEGDVCAPSAQELGKHKQIHDACKEDEKRYAHGFSKIDRIVLNRYLAIPIFLCVMAAIFFLTFGLIGKWLTVALELGIEHGVYNPLQKWLTGIHTPQWAVALLCDGVISGVGGILVFLPQVVLLFFFLAMLEDSGYLSRVAFMTDGLFRKIGLSGRSVFTMLMGFGCSATAVMTARGLEDEKTRKKTVMLTPFMSCSARLPVYAVIASAFFAKGSVFVIFGMYLLGVAVSILFAFIFEKTKRFKSGELSFIMEMPPYRVPTGERVFQIIWRNTKLFLIRVGTVIFALNVIVWLLASFSFRHGFVVGTEYPSILKSIASLIAPVFAPLGFGNWQASSALLAGLVAKEVVVSSIESIGGVDAVFGGNSAAALSFLVFTLLYIPCIATLVTIRKEIGTKWMLATLGLTVATAYVFALCFYWLAILFIRHAGIAAAVLIAAVIGIAAIIIIVKMIKKRNTCGFGCAGCSGSCSKRPSDKEDKRT